MADTYIQKEYESFLGKPLECSNGRNNIIVPKDYTVKAKVRTYQQEGRELIDLEIQADGDLFKEETYFNQVGCDHLRFVS